MNKLPLKDHSFCCCLFIYFVLSITSPLVYMHSVLIKPLSTSSVHSQGEKIVKNVIGVVGSCVYVTLSIGLDI